MKLFKIKVTHKDGSLAQPYTVYADNFSSAVKRIEDRDADMVLSILVQEVSESEAPWWGRTYAEPDELAVQYHDVPWDPTH